LTVYKGWNATIKKDGLEIGYVTEVTVDIDESLEAYYEIKGHFPVRLQEGPYIVTAKLSRAWINTDYLALLQSDTLPEFDLTVSIGSLYTVKLYSCKFTKGAVAIPQDGFLKEDYDIVAKDFGIVS